MIRHVAGNDPDGVQFLEGWIRRLLLGEPERLPYLRLWSAIGDTPFVEALGFITNIVSADSCLQSNSRFNGELEHAKVAVIKNVSVSSPWVTARLDGWMRSLITIERRYEKPRVIQNNLRWVEVARTEKKVHWPVISFKIEQTLDRPKLKQLQDDVLEFRARIVS